MAQVQTEASSVKKGLADRMKPRTAQKAAPASTPAAGGRIDPERFQNPMTARRAKLTRGGLDWQRFQNPNTARQAVGRLPSQGTAARPRPTPQTAQPIRPMPARPQMAQPVQPMPARPAPVAAQPSYPQQQVPGNMPQMPTGSTYQPTQQQNPIAGAPGQVPGQYQTPGRPMPQAPQVAQPVYPQPGPQPVPYPVQVGPQPVQGFNPYGPVAQPAYTPQPAPMPQMAQPFYPQPQWQPQQVQQQYNPTPYTGRW